MPHTRAALVRFARRTFGPELGRRVARLADAVPAYGGTRLRVRSLRFALDFLAEHRDAWRVPDEVLLPASGNLQALWRIDGLRLVAQFLPEQMVWFTVLHDGRLRMTGREAPGDFVAAIHGVQNVVTR